MNDYGWVIEIRLFSKRMLFFYSVFDFLSHRFQPTPQRPSAEFCGSGPTPRSWSSSPSTRRWPTGRYWRPRCCRTPRWDTYSRVWSCSRVSVPGWRGKTSRWRCRQTTRCASSTLCSCWCSTRSSTFWWQCTWRRLSRKTAVSVRRGISR